MSDTNSRVESILAVLREAQDEFVALAAAASDVTAQAYPTEWSIAQVYSHLGSAAEIFDGYLAAGIAGEQPPGQEVSEGIWDRWNAKSPDEQVRDSLEASAAFLAAVEALSPAERDSWQLDMFGAVRNLASLLSFRLNEVVLHLWDVAVVSDPGVTLLQSGTDLIVDGLGMIVQYSAKAPADAFDLAVTTTDPARALRIAKTGEQLALVEDAAGEPTARITLSAEAFVRLAYGRLSPSHAPLVELEGTTLEDLRAVFPGA